MCGTVSMSSSGPPIFPSWLSGVVQTFSMLSIEQQTTTLNQLVKCCGSEQLQHMEQKLPDFLYRDFMQLLPPELTEKILFYLSTVDLLSCCQVSFLWKKRVSCCRSLWVLQAHTVGCNTSLPKVIDRNIPT